jgi:hypothetical protein
MSLDTRITVGTCNGIESCASVIKPLRSYYERATNAYDHLMCCEEFTVTMGALKMVSVDIETCRNTNEDVILYTYMYTYTVLCTEVDY